MLRAPLIQLEYTLKHWKSSFSYWVVTVAAGTQCAWYGLAGPLDAKRDTAYYTSFYIHLQVLLLLPFI